MVPVYALVFTAAMVQSALAPLAPSFSAELHLTRLELGSLFAATSISTLLVALPIGFVTDRLGARALTTGAAALVALSAVGQGLANDFWVLIASRAVFGVGFGAVWTAGLAFLAEGVSVDRRAARLGLTISISGVAISIGPAFAGVLAGQFGLAVPFLVIAVVAAIVTVALAAAPGVPAESQPWLEESTPVLGTLRRARGNRLVVGSIAIMVLAGFSSSVANLLVPLLLRANGLSVSAIGGVLAGAALLYIVVSMCVARLGVRAAKLAVAGAASFGLCLALALPILSGATLALAAFALARSACNAVMSTIAYPLASTGAEQAGIGAGAVIGLTNAAWATATVIAPLAAGALAQALGDRVAFGVLIPLMLPIALWLLIVEPAPGRPQRGHGHELV
jgi:MFS transporter, DHA1 family, solute carrier family 18 (vesicular amine transporter), member 1/2